MAELIDNGWLKHDDPMFTEGFKVFSVRKFSTSGESASISTAQTPPTADADSVPAQSTPDRPKLPISWEEFERLQVLANGGNPLSEQRLMEMNIQYADLLDNWGAEIIANIQGRSERSRQTEKNDDLDDEDSLG